MRAPLSTSILIVDDSSTMRAILRDMLTRLGFTDVDEADGGQEALTRLQSRNYKLVISDWNMEPMDGPELLREVRKRRAGAARFIFATTERSWGHQTTARVEGADAFLTKPFTLQALKDKIGTVLAS